MKQIVYRANKIFRFVLALGVCFLFLWLAPFPQQHASFWIEVPVLIFGLLLCRHGFFGYWVEDVGDIAAGSYSYSLYYGIFGLIIIGHILMRFV